MEGINEKIKQLLETEQPNTNAFKEKKKELREQFVASSKLEEKSAKREFRKLFASLEETFQVGLGQPTIANEEKVINTLLRMGITDKSGIRYGKDSFTNSILNDIVVDNPNESIGGENFQNLIDRVPSFTEEQKETLRKNIDKILSVMNQPEEKRQKVTVELDIRKYLGANDLSKAERRKDIYKFWGETAEKYEAFWESLFGEKGLLNLDYFPPFEISTEDSQNTLAKPKTDVVEGIERIRKNLNKIKNEYKNESLQYIANFSKIDVPTYEKAQDRLISALQNIIKAQQLAEKKEFQMFSYQNEKGRVEEILEEEDEIYDPTEQTLELGANYQRETDPLLAYEILKNKKLISLDKESENFLKETIKQLKKNAVVLDFKTNLDRLLEEVEDSITIDVDNYALPISILENSTLSNYFKEKQPVAYNFKGQNKEITVEVLDKLDNLFDELRKAISQEKFVFAGGVRTYGRAGSLGSITEPREARGSFVESLFRERARTLPQQQQLRGKLISMTKTFKDRLEVVLEAFNDYYIEPLYTGRLPIEIPLYSKGVGVKSLSVLLKDIGGSSLLDEAFENLATTGKASVSISSLRVLANFLIKLDSPKIEVNEDLIILGEQASEGLTDLMGKYELNNNYFARVLKHFMEQTGNMSLLNQDFNGKSIGERADAFDKDYDNKVAFPIFALPLYLDMNQSLMTKDSRRKEQYEKLQQVLDIVEDDLPNVIKMLLEAHDEIRKALKKPVYYGFLAPNFYSYDKMAKYLYDVENIDLSNLEIDNIVKSYDSHKNISREHGITEEQVYLIKANFR